MMQKPVILNEADIDELMAVTDIKAALRTMFVSLSKGQAAQPPQILSPFPDNSGDYITYLGILTEEKVFGAKLSPYIASNGQALVTAWTLLMSMETGAPLLLCDAKKLTAERTAATTILACEVLARDDAAILTIIGTGALGLAHLKYAQSIRNWREIRLCSPEVLDLPHNLAFLETDCPVTRYTETDQAIAEADVIMLCTSSGKPVIDTFSLKDTVLVTSISTNAVNAHEIPPESLNMFDVYCDYRATTPAIAGEMKLATAAGTWNPDLLCADLPELLSGQTDISSLSRPAFFRSVGLGLEDIAAASALLRTFKNNNQS